MCSHTHKRTLTLESSEGRRFAFTHFPRLGDTHRRFPSAYDAHPTVVYPNRERFRCVRSRARALCVASGVSGRQLTQRGGMGWGGYHACLRARAPLTRAARCCVCEVALPRAPILTPTSHPSSSPVHHEIRPPLLTSLRRFSDAVGSRIV
jgi:hypothetical protein